MNASRRGTLIFFLLASLSGCSLGPKVIRHNFLPYNTAIADTENEQFLLNLVRLRYRDPPKTLGLTQVTSQFTFDKFGGGALAVPTYFSSAFAKGFTSASSTTTVGPFQGRATDVPTATMIPQTGADFIKGMVTPVPLERLILLANSGWDIDRLLRLLVQDLNGVENVSHIAGRGAERPPEFRDFKLVAEVLSDLQHNGLMHLVVDPSPVPFANLSEPYVQKIQKMPPAADAKDKDAKDKDAKDKDAKDRDAKDKDGKDGIEIKGSDLIAAADKHYRFHTIEEGKDKGKVVLKGTMDAYDLVLKPEAYIQRNALTAFNLLHFGRGEAIMDRNQQDTGLRAFRLLPADRKHLSVHFDTDKDLSVAMRSLLTSMLFLSKGIEIPAQHYKEGLVAPPPSPSDGGLPFDWPEVTEGLFHVQVAKCRPKKCFVAVRYRGYWFYVADNDLSSKSTFNLLLEMANVQVSPGGATAPILTLSASGPIAR
jgi:hypothetical protein